MLTVLQILAAIGVVVGASSPAPGFENLDLEPIRGLVVQHDGRWPPLDTVARDVVESVTGREAFRDGDSLGWLLAWTFYPKSAMGEPLIAIRNAELRAELDLPASQTVFSYAELVSHPRLRSLIHDLSRIEKEGRKPDPLEQKVSGINRKLVLLQRVFAGGVIRPIPDATDFGGAWLPIGSTEDEDRRGHAGHAHAAGESGPVPEAWAAMREAFLASDSPAFSAASKKLSMSLAALPAAYRPDPDRILTELRYNALRPFNTAWKIMVGGAVLWVIALFVRRRWFDLLAVAGLALGFAVLTWGLYMRWQIAGRIPASNMFESLLFLSWGMGAFCIVSVLVTRQRLAPLTASGMGAFSLALADCLPLDHFVRPIAPVLLDTVWMSIHVPVIMVSYSVLALAVLIAHVQLITMAVAPRRSQLIRTIDQLHYWYVHVGAILLLTGIVTGSMWAASSWGRYWGWDPKEVWSLVAFLAYLAILHVRIDRDRIPRWGYGIGALLLVALLFFVAPHLAPISGVKTLALTGAVLAVALFVLARGEFATAVKSILAFWMIIMTYVGVNYVLGTGLHSYGFGTGAVARYMFWMGGTDLALVALAGVVWMARRERFPTTPFGLPAVSAA